MCSTEDNASFLRRTVCPFQGGHYVLCKEDNVSFLERTLCHFHGGHKDRFKGPFKGRNRAASAEQLEVMQSYNSQETTIFFCEQPKFVARRRSERKQSEKSL